MANINSNYDPGWIAIQTEPDIIKKDLELWKQMWQSYCKEKHLPLYRVMISIQRRPTTKFFPVLLYLLSTGRF